MAESLALVWDLIARDSASPTFARVGASAEGAAAGVGKLLGGLSALAVGSAIAASVDAAAKFQASMLLVQTQAGATAQEVADMSPKILALAGQVAQAPEALATSLYHVESTGLRGAQALEAVTAAAEGAKVGHADLEQTTNALTATIASGMLPATETYSQAMGQLNTIVGSGDMKMSDLNDSLATGLLVTVKQYGVNLNDVGAALADFGDNNLRGADAATKVRMAVQAMESPAKGGAKALAEIGLTQKQLAQDMATGGLNKALTDLHQHLIDSGVQADQWGQILTDAFGKKAGSGVITLVGTFDRFKQKYEEVSKGADTFGNAWDATTKTASFQFSALKDTVDAIGITIGEKLLPPISAFVGWLNSTAIPGVEHFAGSVAAAVQSPQFQNFLKDVVTIGGQAWTAMKNLAGTLSDLGGTILPPLVATVGQLVGFFAGLPGPVQLAVGAFVALRIAAGKGMFDGLISAFGTVRGSFRDFGADVSATAGVLEQHMPRSLATFSGALQTTAERGVGVLQSAGSGLLDMLGGPWGVTLGASAIAIGQWASDVQQATQDTKDWANELINGGMAGAADVQKKYLDQYGGQAPDWLGKLSQSLGLTTSMADVQGAADKLRGSMTQLQSAQADVNTATANYEYLAGQYGRNSDQARGAAVQLQSANQFLKTTQDNVNTATQTHIQLLQQQSNMELASVNSNAAAQVAQLQLTGAIDDFTAKVKDGTLKGDALKIAQANLEQQAIRTAQQQAQAAADTAKANGVTDTSITYNNTLHDALQKLADKYDGPVHDALQQAADATGNAAIKTDDFRDATQKLGFMVAQAWPDGTKVVQNATAQQIDALQQLGYHVTTLPGSDPRKPQTIFVTTNTDAANKGLDDFMQRAKDLGFVGAMWNVGAPIGNGGNGGSPIIGMPGIPGHATGGMIYGPGTGTSDSVPAMLSNGEFVVNAKATAQHSALLHAINSDAIAKYAQGGLVWPAALSAAVMGNLNGALNAQQAARAVAASAGGAARWAPLVDQVLAMLGISRTAEAGVLSMINAESGGNPNAINLTDSNARAGHPSQGLMQTIPGTFARWRNPNLANNILDPLANIYAGVNYALHNYGLGMLMGGGNHGAGGKYIGYKDGTNYVPSDQFALLHRGEAVVPADKNQGAPYRDGGAITLQLDREAVTDLLDGRIVNFADGMYHRGEYNG